MIIEIDQSGKVEVMRMNTVIADSLGCSIMLPTKEKRILQDIYRSSGRPRMFVFEVFSLLTALTIKESFTPTRLYKIDTEYFGQDIVLKSLLVRYLIRLGIPNIESEKISFGFVGKRSLAHKHAYTAYITKNPTSTTSAKSLLTILRP